MRFRNPRGSIWLLIAGWVLVHLPANAMGAARPQGNQPVPVYHKWVEALERRAEANERFGHPENAISDYRAVLKYDPNSKAAKDGLMRLGASPR